MAKELRPVAEAIALEEGWVIIPFSALLHTEHGGADIFLLQCQGIHAYKNNVALLMGELTQLTANRISQTVSNGVCSRTLFLHRFLIGSQARHLQHKDHAGGERHSEIGRADFPRKLRFVGQRQCPFLEKPVGSFQLKA